MQVPMALPSIGGAQTDDMKWPIDCCWAPSTATGTQHGCILACEELALDAQNPDISPRAIQSGELHTVASAVARYQHTVASPGSTSSPADSSLMVAKVRLYLFLSY